MSVKTLWSFSVIDKEEWLKLGSVEICIEFDTKEVAEMVIFRGINTIPKSLRKLMNDAAYEVDNNGVPDYDLKFVGYTQEEDVNYKGSIVLSLCGEKSDNEEEYESSDFSCSDDEEE